jgi:hypothetical protein
MLPEGGSIVSSVVHFKHAEPFSYLLFRLLGSFGFTESAAVCGRLESRIFFGSAAMSGHWGHWGLRVEFEARLPLLEQHAENRAKQEEDNHLHEAEQSADL